VRLARVIGNVVATAKDPSFEGSSLLLLQPLDDLQRPMGPPLVATDSMRRRGLGEIVYIVQSGDAVHTGVNGQPMPTDAAVMGIANVLHSIRQA
jgi:ethanolamine utilization protein EutN